jgi:ribosomal protein S28E/S33
MVPIGKTGRMEEKKEFRGRIMMGRMQKRIIYRAAYSELS